MFDAVGTLIYPEPSVAQVYAETGRRFGSNLTQAEVAERFRQAFRQHEQDDFAGSLQTSEEAEFARWRRIVGQVLVDVTDPESCFDQLFEHFARSAAWRTFPDVPRALDQLVSRGHTVGIASNFDERLLGISRQLAPLDRCQFVLVSSQIGFRKPHRKFFEAIASHVGLPADQILYVGDDRVNDLDGARTIGMPSVLVDRSGCCCAPSLRSLEELLA